MTREEALGRELLAIAGVEVNGPRPFDIQVHNPDFFKRAIAEGSLGFGESYMDGWWDCAALDECLAKILKADLRSKVSESPGAILTAALAKVSNRQAKPRAYNIAYKHYDIGNDLYEAMLGDGLIYTCGYWKSATTLPEAQEAKLDLVCKKIGLKAGQTVLDIGCGWGGFARFAAQRYGAKTVGITVSKEQKSLGEELCRGLPVEFRLQDYREITGSFDHIISLGMFEHVGPKNHRAYMEVARRCLKDDGLFLLHTIGGNVSDDVIDPWIDRYIFPDAVLPSVKQISGASEGLFVMEDWHNFGAYYDTTLMAWYANFEAHWGTLKQKYDERFHRMWRYYLHSCAATFRIRKNQLWQIVFSKGGVPGGYQAIR